MHSRRTFLGLGALALGAALPALAQPRPRLIGYLSATSPESNIELLDAFRQGMQALGQVEGRDYVIDARYADGVADVVPSLAQSLVAARPEVLLATTELTWLALAQRTSAIPVVATLAHDPVESGFVSTLQRPGRNVTGLTDVRTELSGKRLEVLKEAFPRVAHAGVLFDAGDPLGPRVLKDSTQAAARLNVRVTPIPLRAPSEIGTALKRSAAFGIDALVVSSTPLVSRDRQTLIDGISLARLPALFSDSASAQAGGLMSYGASIFDSYRRAASYVDRIFKGAQPGELAFEAPAKFELVVNMKTAKATGLDIAPSILSRADRIIQ
jgi:putative tryptophan/tyrosine transport system substrate-binding protein